MAENLTCHIKNIFHDPFPKPSPLFFKVPLPTAYHQSDLLLPILTDVRFPLRKRGFKLCTQIKEKFAFIIIPELHTYKNIYIIGRLIYPCLSTLYICKIQ